MTGAPPDERIRVKARLQAQLLTGSEGRDTAGVLDRLLAIQAQDLRGARLAVRARSGLTGVADVDDALDQGRAVITWLNRGTLHLVRAEDYRWLHPLVAARPSADNRRRLRQEGLSEAAVARGLDVVAQALQGEVPLTRAELKVRLDDDGVRTEGQALMHLLFAASRLGLVVRGPLRDGEPAYVDVAGWLGPAPAALNPEEALARLAERYLAGHGPATAADLAKWAGVTLGQARSGLASAGGEVMAGDGGYWARAGTPAPGALPPPRLLGAFDPVLHGWVDRGPVVGRHREVVTVNGIFRPTALVGGRVVGWWGLSDGAVRLHLLERVNRRDLGALEEDAGAVLAYLGLPPSTWAVDRP
jgi:Winged helix DNA-binding domain